MVVADADADDDIVNVVDAASSPPSPSTTQQAADNINSSSTTTNAATNNNSTSPSSSSSSSSSWLSLLFNKLWTAMVDLVASFMAQVLSHPSVKEAGASVMVAGIDATLKQPDLIRRVVAVLHVQGDGLFEGGAGNDGAKELGAAFPKLAAEFVGGAVTTITGIRGKEDDEIHQVKEEKQKKSN